MCKAILKQNDRTTQQVRTLCAGARGIPQIKQPRQGRLGRERLPTAIAQERRLVQLLGRRATFDRRFRRG